MSGQPSAGQALQTADVPVNRSQLEEGISPGAHEQADVIVVETLLSGTEVPFHFGHVIAFTASQAYAPPISC